MAEKDDRYLAGQIEDKIRQAAEYYMVTHTGFLDPHAYAVAQRICRGGSAPEIRKVFTGGYPEAERVILLCLPDYAAEEAADIPGGTAAAEVLTVIRASVKPGGRKLKHGDYLGSVLGLGLDRSAIGDILVREDGADLIVLKEIAEFLMTHYAKAGRSYLELEEKPLGELIVPEAQRQVCTDTLASLRLDNLVSSAFGLSRAKAQEAIRRGLVFLNSQEELRTDREFGEEDRVTLRGSGKVIVTEIGGRSRKDRIYVTWERFL